MPLLIPIFLICLAASVIGAICGIGGGVIMKPVLDALHIMSVQQVSFLSGCTVLCMSAYSVAASRRGGKEGYDFGTLLPLSIGAALGGVCGKLLFQQLSRGSSTVGAVQSGCLLLLTVGTFLYTLFQARVRTKRLSGFPVCAATGLLLGVFSSFLGIGGGPINLVVLSFLFSMDVKSAAKSSLFIILISQIASLLFSVFTRSIPDIAVPTLIVMALSGICGGVIGRSVNKRIAAGSVRKLFLGANVLIICICVYNIASSLS